MFKWFSCAGCRAKDAEIARLKAQSEEFFGQIKTLHTGILAKLNEQPQPLRRAIRPAVEIQDQRELLGKPPRPPWVGSLIADGHYEEPKS